MSAVSALNALGTLTAHRDRESMEAELVSTLLDLTPSYMNSLYRVRVLDDNPIAQLIARSQQKGVIARDVEGETLSLKQLAAVTEALSSGEIQQLYSDDQGVTTLVAPMDCSGLDEEIVLVQQSIDPRPEQGELVAGLLRVYGNFLALFYEQARDKLTGLLNRATLNSQLDKLVAKHSKGDKRRNDRRQHWLGVLDIDHFKQINDRFGHLYGDEILILVSRLMRDSFREEDLLFRYGGEEFIIMLQVDSADQAMMAFERFRKKVADTLFPQVGKVTLSIGMVEVEGHLDATDVIGNADKALYFSKANGRNQSNSYEVLVATGDVIDERVESQEIEFF